MPPKRAPRPLGDRPIVARRGHRDYVRLDNGKLAVVRVWDHHSGTWRLNSLGRRWAAEQQSEFVVSIPIIMVNRRKDGSEQSFKGYLPASNVRMHSELKQALALGAGLERRQAITAIKNDVKQRLEKYREDDGDIVLFYESDVVAVYDDSPSQSAYEL